MALSKKVLEAPSEIEMLLPWHVTGRLDARDARRVGEAMTRNPELARQYAAIREEYAETIWLNESLGAPSGRAMQKLFAAIDTEPSRPPKVVPRLPAGIRNFFARVSPRTLAWSASLGAIALLLQGAIIGAVLMKSDVATYLTASMSMNEPITGPLGQQPPRALVRFAPDARISDVSALLDSYQASIIDASKGGMFRLQFGDKAMTKGAAATLTSKLQHEKIVNLAMPTP